MKKNYTVIYVILIVLLAVSSVALFRQNTTLKENESYTLFHMFEWTLIQSQQDVDTISSSEEIDSVHALSSRFLRDFPSMVDFVSQQNEDVKVIVKNVVTQVELDAARNRIMKRNESLKTLQGLIYEKYKIDSDGSDHFSNELLKASKDENHELHYLFEETLNN